MSSGDLFNMEIDWEVKEEIDTPFLFEEIEKELKTYLLEQQVKEDSADGAFDFLDNLTKRLQEDFDKIVRENSDKKSFIKSLTRVCALLLNTKVDTVGKIKKILKIAVKTTLKIWSGQN